MVGDRGRKGVVSTMGGMDVSLLFRRIVATLPTPRQNCLKWLARRAPSAVATT